MQVENEFDRLVTEGDAVLRVAAVIRQREIVISWRRECAMRSPERSFGDVLRATKLVNLFKIDKEVCVLCFCSDPQMRHRMTCHFRILSESLGGVSQPLLIVRQHISIAERLSIT